MSIPTFTTINATGATVTLNATPNGGQATMANSLPMAIASDQSALPVNGWQPNGSFASLTAGVATSQVTLPTGAVVVVWNNGANVAYLNLGTTSGVTAATTQIPLQPASWIALTVGANTNLAAITATSTSQLTLAGGAGLATGAGGGSSGGGGGGNAAAGLTGAAVPTSGGYTAFNVSGNLVGVSAANPLPVALAAGANTIGAISNTTFAATGTFWQATQPVSIATMPSTPVTGTFWQATQPVSNASLPLPAGAATSALQTAMNTALGTPFQAGGSVGISGTLPAFTATPTVNIGTMPTTTVTGTIAGTIADGADVSLGAKADVAWTTGAGSIIAVLKAIDRDTLLPLSAGANLIGQVQPALSAISVLTLAVENNFAAYGSVRFQVDSLSGGDIISFGGSVATGGTKYPLQQVLNTQTGTVTTTITASGAYVLLFAGGLFVTATKTGVASTPVITASASQ